MAILRGKCDLNSARDVFEYAKEHLSATGPLSSCSRRIFKYADDIDRSRDRYFKAVADNRTIHQVVSVGNGHLRVSTLSCYSCDNCLRYEYSKCCNQHRFAVRNVEMLKCTGGKEGQEEIGGFQIKDMVTRNSLLVVYTDDAESDYYLFKASGSPEILSSNTTDDWGNSFPHSAEVVCGCYYTNVGKLSFKLLKDKFTIISVNSIVCALPELKTTVKLNLPEATHEQVLGWVEECR